MSTSVRSFLSASIGPGLTAVTVASAYFNGPLAMSTTVAFGLTVVWGIVEIALLSYTPIASIDLDGPSLLSDDTETLATPSASARNVVEFSDSNPWRERAA